MCLLHWLYTQGIFNGYTVVAAHFNHQLRGEESDRDEAFVREVCDHWPPDGRQKSYLSHAGEWIPPPPMPLTVGRGDVRAFARQEGLSIEEGARVLRYAFLERAAQAEGCDVIATAHTSDDNAETVLMHLLRGTGLEGLTGINPKRGKLIRPLLTTSRQEIEAYLAEYHIPHVEDSTNQNDDFLRNKVRHQLVPLLEKWNPGFVRRMSQTLPRLRADNDYLDALAADLSKKAVVEDGAVSLPALFVSGAPGPVAARVIRQLLGMTPVGSTDCAAAHLEAVLALCRSDAPSGEVHLPHGLTARREYDKLILTQNEKPRPLSPFAPVQGENPVPGTGWVAILNGEPWPGLVIRSRQQGDEITLPGRPRRSLKKLFIDRKIPRWSRETIPLAADPDGVLAVAGLGVNRSHPKGACVQFILQKKEERET